MIPPETLEELKHQLPLENLVREYLPLQRRGRNLVGLCPFHQEKTPSFNVNPERNSYKCFGCGKSGNVFTFLMDKEGLTFVEAAEEIARRVGVALPRSKYQEGTRRTLEDKERFYAILAKAQEWFRANLRGRGASAVRDYLQERGLKGETIDRFGLGYAPDGWQILLEALGKTSQDQKDLLSVGLIREKGDRRYDFFRHRVMFPIHDLQGRVVAFGGRILPSATPRDKEPKYSNSPETPLFKKSRTIYGLHLAKDAIRQQDRVSVVEGYMDVIMCAQWGMTNVVATLGTALGEEHGRLLGRFTRHITFLYDGDDAGQKAMQRGIRVLLPQDFAIRGVTLPSQHDPDTYLQAEGPEGMRELERKAPDAIDFLLRSFAKGRDLSSSHDRKEVITACGEFITSPLLEDEFERRLAGYLRMDLQLVRYALSSLRLPYRQQGPPSSGKPATTEDVDPVVRLQRRLLVFMLREHRYAVLCAQQLLPSDFTHGPYRKVVDTIFAFIERGIEVTPEGLYDTAAMEGFLETLEELIKQTDLALEFSDEETRAEIEATTHALKILHLREEISRLQQQIRDLLERGERDPAMTLMEQRRAKAQQLDQMRHRRTAPAKSVDAAEDFPFA